MDIREWEATRFKGVKSICTECGFETDLWCSTTHDIFRHNAQHKRKLGTATLLDRFFWFLEGI